MYTKPMRVVFALLLIASVLVILITTFANADGHNSDISKPKITNAYETEIDEVKFEPLAVQYTEVVEETWPYPITQGEIELIALITMGEAEGESELGKRLVIDTILNRKDDPTFPDTIHDVIYYPNAFSVVSNGRLERCYVMPEIVELVKEELLDRTNFDCKYFCSTGYSKYGTPMFQEGNHYFSSN